MKLSDAVGARSALEKMAGTDMDTAWTQHLH